MNPNRNFFVTRSRFSIAETLFRSGCDRLGLALFTLGCLLLSLAYVYKIAYGEAGSDLLWRITEAKYFLREINPFDEFVRHTKTAKDFGQIPAAYSFISYYFASALYLATPNDQSAIIIFAVLDVCALILGVNLLIKYLGVTIRRTLIVFPALLGSVFFWQHLAFLNYTVIATLGLILVVYGLSIRRTLFVVIGALILGLKPSFAIPTFIFLLIAKEWRILFYIALLYLLLLILTALQIHTNPVDILLQLLDTQRIFSEQFYFYRSEGLFLFLRPWVGSQLTLIGLATTCLILGNYRKVLYDPYVSLILVASCGVSLFYNQVHAWIAVYPLLILALNAYLDDKLARLPLISLVSLIIFVIAPRLSGMFSEMHMDTYLYLHNIVRFSLLWLASGLLIHLRVKQLKSN